MNNLKDPSFYQNKAEELFKQGYNCSQSVVLAFADILDVDTNKLLKLASPFGGGMGRLRETCGAFTGILIVLGLLEGYSTPEQGEIKNELYAKVQYLGKQIEAEFHSIICRELLNKKGHDSPISEARTKEFYETRPCCKIIGFSALKLAEYLQK